LPGPTLLTHGTADAFLVPIHLQMTAITGVGVMSLPALLLTPGPPEVHLVLVLTCAELCASGGGPIAHRDPGEAVWWLQRLVQRRDDGAIRLWGHRRCHRGDAMRSILVTRLGELPLVAAPVCPPLLAVTGVEVIRRSAHHR
jgi:hypothetical protein